MSIKPGYIRVSEILGQWPQYEGIDENVLKRKAELGTEVHDAIKAHQECIHLTLPEKAQGYFESYLTWYGSIKPEVQIVGRLYCDKLKITGEIDALVKFPGSDGFAIVDWKTTESSHDLMWQLQGQFYHYLCSSNGLEPITRFFFVQLKRDGTFPKVKEFKSGPPLMNVCMSAYVCYRYLNKIDKK